MMGANRRGAAKHWILYPLDVEEVTTGSRAPLRWRSSAKTFRNTIHRVPDSRPGDMQAVWRLCQAVFTTPETSGWWAGTWGDDDAGRGAWLG